MNLSVIKAYDGVLQSYRKLQESIVGLIKASGLKHKEIFTNLGLKKDTFYRRLRFNDWTYNELKSLLPFLIRKVKHNDPQLYEKIVDQQEMVNNASLAMNLAKDGESHSDSADRGAASKDSLKLL